MATPLTHVSAAHELPDGRVVVTNARQPSVLIIDPVKGTVTPLGTAGGGRERYAKPGGLYAGPGGTTLLVDRAQTQVFTIARDGTLQPARSIARKGVSESSDADQDLQRLDARGFTYFVDRASPRDMLAGPPKESTLVRFNPESQAAEPIAGLRLPERRAMPGGGGMVITRAFLGSPADGWGVAPDGRVAIVRADPYRVEWMAPDGAVTRGPIVEHDILPMTEADKQHYAATRKGTVGVGMTGGAKIDDASMGLLFAPTKAPFEPDDVQVSPEGRVWVMRARPIEARDVVYDVFDGAARREHRIQFPAGSRVIGFGPGSVYVRHNDEQGRCELRKFRVK
jgi:hypothetical protein